MSNPLHAAHYADQAVARRVPIQENVALARDTYRVRLNCPEITGPFIPGQFVMLRIAHCDDPLIGRPLAVYDLDAAGTLDLIYHVKGKFTTRLAQCLPGQSVDVWGPLGNGFPPLSCIHLVLVAGGVGHTPLLSLAKEHLGRQSFGRPPRNPRPVRRITFCYGTQSSDLMAGVDDFRALGIDVRLATEDGSAGRHGLATDLLHPLLSEAADARDTTSIQIVCCGPVAMMRSVAEMAAERHVACLVSLETPMACGIGICFSCVARIRGETGDWDYQRTCVEGPIFDATRVAW